MGIIILKNPLDTIKFMLTRILDTSAIDMDDLGIQYELAIDLRRMNALEHESAPENITAYKVKVTPSTQTYSEGLHRFRFEIQYGNLNNNHFEPKGESVFYQTETLPMI